MTVEVPRETTSRIRIPVATALVGGVAALIALAVGSVLLLTFLAARDTTIDLLRDRAEIGLELLETRVRGQLDPVRATGVGLAAMIAEGAIDTLDPVQVRAAFLAALTAIPQASAVIFIDTSLRAARVGRSGDPLVEVVEAGLGIVGMGGMTDTHDGLMAMLEGAAAIDDAKWLPPLWVQSLKQPVLALEVPVRRADEFLGALIVVVEMGSIAEFLARLEAEKSESAFVLYDSTYVLAHPRLTSIMLVVGGEEVPLPVAATFADAAVAGLASAPPSALARPGGLDSRTVGGAYLVTTREVSGYTELPWRIGLTFDAAEAARPLDALRSTALIGLGVLGAAVALGWLFSRFIAKRIQAMSAAASKLATLDVEGVERQADSNIAEFADAAKAFNAMTTGLRWFETYVPKSLVLRLMRESAGSAGSDVTVSTQRTLTVMFTDIKGFSTMAERMEASHIAAMLNRHFEIVSNCIEVEGGTVDKFIGDSVMAFWGAPEAVADHAARAVRAAAAIQSAVVAENRARAPRGEDPIHVRIGLHTGPVVVGNIGSKSRVNYTVVGDTVNAASRLESLAKDLHTIADDDSQECVVLLSEATRAGVAGGGTFRSLGRHTLRGRVSTVEVFQLVHE